MELTADEGADADLGDDPLGPCGRARRDSGIRVREVEGPAVVHVSPAHARDAPRADALGAPGDEAEARHAAALVRPVERQLQSETDPEDRPPRAEALPQRDVVATAAQAGQRRRRRAHAGEHGDICAGDIRDHVDAVPAERKLDRAHVARAVLADRRVHIVPLVEGRPSPSARTALRSARPTALNAASATWCSSRPVASTWIAARAACARLASMWPARPGSRSSASSAWGRPPRSTAARASASSIGTTASP